MYQHTQPQLAGGVEALPSQAFSVSTIASREVPNNGMCLACAADMPTHHSQAEDGTGGPFRGSQITPNGGRSGTNSRTSFQGTNRPFDKGR